MPRRELDSHSVTPATYTVDSKFRRSDKFAQQEKPRSGECGAEGGVQAHS
jgi:hypothetical protein